MAGFADASNRMADFADADLRRLLLKADAMTGILPMHPNPLASETAAKLLCRAVFPEAERFDGLLAVGLRQYRAEPVQHGCTPHAPNSSANDAYLEPNICARLCHMSTDVELPACERPFVASAGPPHCEGAEGQGPTMPLDSVVRLKVRVCRLVARLRLNTARTPGNLICDRTDAGSDAARYSASAALAAFSGVEDPGCVTNSLVPVTFLFPVDFLRTSPGVSTRVFVIGKFSTANSVRGSLEQVEMLLDDGTRPLSNTCNIADPTWSSTMAYRATVNVPPGVVEYRFVLRYLPPRPAEWVVLPDALASVRVTDEWESLEVETRDASDPSLMQSYCNAVFVQPLSSGIAVDGRDARAASEGTRPRDGSTNSVASTSHDNDIIDPLLAAFAPLNGGGSAVPRYSDMHDVLEHAANNARDLVMQRLSHPAGTTDNQASSVPVFRAVQAEDALIGRSDAGAALRAAALAHRMSLRMKVIGAKPNLTLSLHARSVVARPFVVPPSGVAALTDGFHRASTRFVSRSESPFRRQVPRPGISGGGVRYAALSSAHDAVRPVLRLGTGPTGSSRPVFPSGIEGIGHAGRTRSPNHRRV